MQDNVTSLNEHMRLLPKKSQVRCSCNRVFAVEHTRMLECQDCGKCIDPFEFLLKQANSQQRLAFDIQHAQHERDRLNNDIENLKREKRNLQAQVRNIKNKCQ